jgi:hypothetical protein
MELQDGNASCRRTRPNQSGIGEHFRHHGDFGDYEHRCHDHQWRRRVGARHFAGYSASTGERRAEAAQAQADLLAAYNVAKALPPGAAAPFALGGGADLSGLTLPPGVYTSGSTILINGPAAAVLDAGGNPDAVWVFQIGSSLTTVTGSVSLIGGAQAKNVFWVPTAAATIGSGTTFEGTILAGGDVTANTGATINGRILAGAIGAGTVALQATTVNVPAP